MHLSARIYSATSNICASAHRMVVCRRKRRKNCSTQAGNHPYKWTRIPAPTHVASCKACAFSDPSWRVSLIRLASIVDCFLRSARQFVVLPWGAPPCFAMFMPCIEVITTMHDSGIGNCKFHVCTRRGAVVHRPCSIFAPAGGSHWCLHQTSRASCMPGDSIHALFALCYKETQQWE